MYLHEDRGLFEDAIGQSAEFTKRPIAVVEKDYYLTMILKLLSERAPDCTFKGGTSLAKCYHVIRRFSEDIDITFTTELTQGEKRHLKNDIIAGISDELGLPIIDFENARSRRDYNCYTFGYQPIEGFVQQSLKEGIMTEVYLGSVSFPTEKMMIDSFVYQYLSQDNMDIAKEYGLIPFEMNVQSITRSFTDKVFALCDYYLAGDPKRHSRHVYDIYMLYDQITFDDSMKQLIAEVRKIRSKMINCPSAKPDNDISHILKQIIDTEFYKADYIEINDYFADENVPYEEAVKTIGILADNGMF